MKGILGAMLGVLMAGPFAQAAAADIEYSLTGSGSGSLGGQAFSGAFSITAIGETATQAPCVSAGSPVSGCAYVVNKSVDLDIAGIGDVSLVNPSISFVNNSQNLFGVVEIFPPSSDLNFFAYVNLGGASPAFSTWDGVSDLAPLSTTLTLDDLYRPVVDTSGGELIFDSEFESSAATFSANLLGASVPEPATWTTMLVGFCLVGAAVRRRTRAARQHGSTASCA